MFKQIDMNLDNWFVSIEIQLGVFLRMYSLVKSKDEGQRKMAIAVQDEALDYKLVPKYKWQYEIINHQKKDVKEKKTQP